jgi:hypothetical protein
VSGDAVAAGACTERELIEPVALCRSDGALSPEAIGWARRPLIDCSLPGRWGRRKRWDFWAVTGPALAMNLTLADVDYLTLADVWFRDLDTGEEVTATAPLPMGGRLALSPRAGEGVVERTGRSLRLRFADDAGGTTLTASCRTEAGPFEAQVRAERPVGHEALTVVIPWSDRRYQCTTKDVARPATGTVRWGDRSYEPAWACLDFGRGRWPYRTTWNWGAGAGIVDGRRIGIQVGGRWTDGTGMTENALVVGGRLSKLSEELVWTYDRADWLRPWRVRTPRSDRLDLTLTPVHDKVSRLQIGVAASAVDQCFGTWSGRIVPDDGEPIEVDGLFGWAEEATWRW